MGAPWTGPRPCSQCGHPMRPSGQTEDGVWEGTRAHQGKGLCAHCYRRTDSYRGYQRAHYRTHKGASVPEHRRRRVPASLPEGVPAIPKGRGAVMTVRGMQASAVVRMSQDRTVRQEKRSLAEWIDRALAEVGLIRVDRIRYRVWHGSPAALTATTAVTKDPRP